MKQFKLIGDDGKEYGPVTVEGVAQWITDGRTNGETKVQPEGSEDWQPLREVPELENLLGGKAPKPAAQPGLPPTLNTPPTTAQVLEDLGDRPPTFNVGECIGQGWRLYKANIGLFSLSTLSLMGLSFVAVFVPFGSLLAGGPLFGSYDMIMVKRLRGEPARVGNLFDGFKNFMEMFIAYLMVMVATMLALIPCMVVIGLGILVTVMMAKDGAERSEMIIAGIVIAGLSVLSILPCYLIWAMLSFSLPLALDKNLPGMEAVKTAWGITKKCKAKCLGLVLAMGTINILPYVPCIVGMLALAVTESTTIKALLLVGVGGILLGMLLAVLVCAPVSFASHAAVYEKLFGPQSNEPASA